MTTISKIGQYINFRTQASHLFEKMVSAKINSFEIETETKLMSDTQAFRKNLVRHLCVNEALDDPTQGTLSEWMKYFTTSELVKLAREAKLISPRQTLTALVAVDGNCHALAAFNWFLNETLGKENKENLSIYTGIADKTFAHSWIYNEDKSILYEPTNIERESYFGYKVEDPLNFFINESNRIFMLIKEGDIPAKIGEYYTDRFKEFFHDVSYSHEEYLRKLKD